MGESDRDAARDEAVLTRTRKKTDQPRLYRVLLHNDDYTTMEFVVSVLMEVFHKPRTQAEQIMLTVHMKGIGVAGVYTRDVADTKVTQTTKKAREHGMPLKCTCEPDE